MKIILFLLAAALSIAAEEAQPVPSQPQLEFLKLPQVRMDVLMVSVPEAEALKLLPTLRDSKTIEAGQKAILDLVAEKKATLIAWPEVTAHDGQHALTESIVEKPYATEPSNSGAAEAKRSEIEIKNIGVTVELDASVAADEKSATIQIAPHRVALLAMEDIAITKSENRGSEFKYPRFVTQKVTTTITLRDSERQLVLADKSGAADGFIDLFIVGVKIIPVVK